MHPVYTDGVHSLYKDGVYQPIEDEIDEQTEPRSWLWPAGLAGGAIVLIAAYLFAMSSGSSTGVAEPIGPEPEARQAYLRALGEGDAALRRARLTDFLNQYSSNPRSGAARAQLDVLDMEADRDWQDTLTTAYDPRLDIAKRRLAVYTYQREWGRYLGARDAEIETLLEDIERDIEGDARPDRTLPRDPEAYAGMPDNQLMGGPYGRNSRVRFRTLPRPGYKTYGESGEVFTETGEVIAPRVVRNVTPRYPRRAERRGIDAVVTLSLIIGADGRVDEVELVRVDADRYEDDFVREAERAALRTRFEPKTVGGVPTEAVGVRKRYRFDSDR